MQTAISFLRILDLAARVVTVATLLVTTFFEGVLASEYIVPDYPYPQPSFDWWAGLLFTLLILGIFLLLTFIVLSLRRREIPSKLWLVGFLVAAAGVSLIFLPGMFYRQY